MRSIFFVILLFCQKSLAVYGGSALPAELNDRSLVVRIQASEQSSDNFNCSAVIAESQTLLTAAHCTEDLRASEKLIVIDPKTGIQNRILISSVIRHPTYHLGFRDKPNIPQDVSDIAIINLRYPISFSHAQATLQSSELAFPTTGVLVATGLNGSHFDSNLALAIGIQNFPAFNSRLLLIKAEKENAGPCEGDSGGGIFTLIQSHYVLIGIQSLKTSSKKCGNPNSQGFAVSIEENLSWISKSALHELKYF